MQSEEHTCFYNQNFIAVNPLTKDTIIEYFSLSQFYDRGCINEILKMQSQFANIDISHKLTTTVGFYYILSEEFDNLFIIEKREFDGNKTFVLKVYYCMFGYIYTAPTAKSISECRIIDSFFRLNSALLAYEEKKKFNWLSGFQFKNESEIKEKDEKDKNFMLEILSEFELNRRLNK